MEDAAEPYVYAPLDQSGSGRIRVLQVENNIDDQCISGTLLTVDLKTESHKDLQHQWTAISYAWEGQLPTEPISIDGRCLKVTLNVAQILRNVRPRTCCLWIDALCIDQANIGEKSQQVLLMKDIFREAYKVVVFLGSPSPKELGSSFQLVCAMASWLKVQTSESVSDSRDLQAAFSSADLQHYPKLQCLYPYEDLASCSWFDRLWVVQEAAIARSLYIQHGQFQIEWEYFASTALRFLSGLNARDALKSSLSWVYGACVERYHTFAMGRMLTMIYTIYQLRRRIKNRGPTAPSQVVSTFADRKSTLAIDKIYALCGLFEVKRDRGEPLRVDYRLTAAEVYQAFTIWCIEQERSLDVITRLRDSRQRQWILQHDPQAWSLDRLPSWVADWTHGPMSLYGGEMTTLALRTGQEQVFPHKTRPQFRVEGPVLIVKGFFIDTVKALKTLCPFESYGSDEGRARLIEWQHSVRNDANTNVILFGQEQPSKDTLRAKLATTVHKERRTAQLWLEKRRPRLVADSPQRRHSLLTERGCIAFASASFQIGVKLGDRICAFYGGRALFLLRSVESSQPGRPYYRLISGDCFIDGFEDGRGIEMARRLGVPEEEIAII
ncbi:MAG: hypothetical protein Q9218_002091 [Villophora microphyllina]